MFSQVYEHLVFEGSRHVSLRSLPGMLDRCVQIGSAGKTFSLTGWKVRMSFDYAPAALFVAMQSVLMGPCGFLRSDGSLGPRRLWQRWPRRTNL
jgi:hypothetical protein